jgi:hypothetical protein
MLNQRIKEMGFLSELAIKTHEAEKIHQYNDKTSKTNPIYTVQVYETYDYDLFTFVDSNRPVDQKHVNNLIKSMKKKLLKTRIIVNSGFEILDGQHRYTALKTLGLPIHFEIDDDFIHEDISEKNSNQKNWTALQHLEFAAYYGNQKAIDFLSLMEDFPEFTQRTVCYALGAFSSVYHLLDSNIRNSEIKELDTVKARYNMEQLRKFDGVVPFATHHVFTYAITFLMKSKDFSVDKLIEKIKYSAPPYFYNKVLDMAKEVERVYNYRNRNYIKLIDEKGQILNPKRS